MKTKREKYFEWDVDTWGRALPLWNEALLNKRGDKALEIGARRGGLSLFLAGEHQMQVICSDLDNPKQQALALHKEHDLENSIRYQAVDCTNIESADNQFDVVIFKSVLGSLREFDRQKSAFNEMRRVLKPGGMLLFAENMEGSWLHIFARKRFIPWASYWRYLSLGDVDELINSPPPPFNEVKIAYTGFLSVFSDQKSMKKLLSTIDNLISCCIPDQWKYVVYGYAIK